MSVLFYDGVDHMIEKITTLIKGKANNSHKHGNGDITSLDAGKITSGTISIDRLPQGALERLTVVTDDTARFKLTSSNVQKGDTVKVISTGKMYYIVDETKLSSEDGYEVYAAGTAASVPWSGVTGKPSTYTPSSHTHTKSQIIDFPTKVSSFQNDSNYQTDTDVTNAIDDIHIGGKNMCIGTNQGTKNWRWSMRTGTYTNEEVLEDGIRTCKMTRGDDAQSGWTVIGFDDISRDKWLPDTNYIITVEVKSNVNATFTLYGLAAHDGTGNLSSKIDVVNNKTKSGEWVTLQWLCKTRNSLPTQTNQILYMNDMNSEPGVYYQFRNLKIEKGNKPTDWSPAPEDIEGEINNKANKSETTVNLLHSTLSTFTKNGVTLTNNGDGTYTLTGTATADTAFTLTGNIIKEQLSDKLPLKLLGGVSNNVYVQYLNMSDANKSIADKGTGGVIINDAMDNSLLCITILAGETLPNVVVKPMLTTNLDATYDDFVSYTGNSGSLNRDVASLLKRIDTLEDDLEEGDFLGILFNDSVSFIASAQGRYKKVESMVYIYISVLNNTSNTPTGLKGLPFNTLGVLSPNNKSELFAYDSGKQQIIRPAQISKTNQVLFESNTVKNDSCIELWGWYRI